MPNEALKYWFQGLPHTNVGGTNDPKGQKYWFNGLPLQPQEYVPAGGPVNVSVNVSGQALTADVGTATVTTTSTVSVTATGQQLTVSVGIATVTVIIPAYLRPTGDDLIGSWTDYLGGNTLSDELDEATRDDVDFIRSPNNPLNSACRINLGPPGLPIDGTQPVKVGYTLGGSVAGLDVIVRLMQNTTQIASWTHTGIATTDTLFEQTLTTGERTSINWASQNTLKLEFEANKP